MIPLLVLEKLWTFVQKYWQTILLVLVLVGAGTWVGCQQTRFTKRLDEISEAHRTELEAVKKAYETEIQVREENEQKLVARMTEIQKQYDQAKLDLDAEKKREVADIVKKYGDNPDELAKQLANATGFSVVMPTEEDLCTP